MEPQRVREKWTTKKSERGEGRREAEKEMEKGRQPIVKKSAQLLVASAF